MRRKQSTIISSFANLMNRILVTRRTHKSRVLATNVTTLNYMATEVETNHVNKLRLKCVG
jgi:hypothetical protein